MKQCVTTYSVRPARKSDPPERVVSSTDGPVVIVLDLPEVRCVADGPEDTLPKKDKE